MDSVTKIKNIFEKKKSDEKSDVKGNERRLSTTIKNKVNMYEKQIEDYEAMRKNKNMTELARKFGLNKYLKKDKSKQDQFEGDNELIDLKEDDIILNENRLEKFVKEIQVMCDNYEKEIEILKTKCSSSIGTNLKNCHLCDKLINVIDHKKALLNEKEDELMALKEEMLNLQKKYKDLDLHISYMIENLEKSGDYQSNYITSNKDLDKSLSNFHLDCFNDNYKLAQESKVLDVVQVNEDIKIEVNKNEEIIKERAESYPDEILTELISEYIFKEYISNNSISLHSLNSKLLNNNNFISYLTTCFTNYKNTNLTLSIYHEYLQDIIIQIYIAFRKYKKKNNNAHSSWLISEENINDEVIQATVDEIFYYYSNLNTKNCNLDMEQNFEKLFDNFNTASRKYFENLRKDVMKNFINRVVGYYKIIKDDICKLVQMCRNFIHAGKLFYKRNIIYDYWKLFHDATTFEQGNNFIYDQNMNNLENDVKQQNKNNKICYYQSPEAPDYSDYLINFIKFNNSNIDTLYIHGARITSLEDEDDFILKLPMSMILSSILIKDEFIQRLKYLSITNLRLEEDAMYTLNKIIEFSQSLATLDLSRNNLHSEYLRTLSETLKKNNSISRLNLSYDRITSNSTFYLSEMLLKNTAITTLNLSGNSIKELGLQSLINIFINSNKSVKSIDLSHNNLERDDINIINNLIMKNCENLEILNLSSNNFDLDCINSFGLALRGNRYIKTLYLNKIGLDADSTPYFMQHMMEFNLQDLYLDENDLGEVGGVLFSNVIKNNHKLKTVSLKNTNQNSNSLSCIAHALELEIKLNGLKNIYLDNNKFGYAEINNLVNIYKTQNVKGNAIHLPKIYFSAEYLDEISINKLISLETEKFILV